MKAVVSDDTDLLAKEILEELAGGPAIRTLVQAIRAQETELGRLLGELSPASVRRLCQQSIVDLLPNPPTYRGFSEMHPAEFARAICGLKHDVGTAPHRRTAREVSRVVALLCGDGIPRPNCADDFHLLWEYAMEGEPRWEPDFPTSAFRKKRARIYKSMFSDELLQICAHPDNYERELERLVAFLADDQVPPEARAGCAYALLEWIHPFVDGNGHTGRMLMFSALQDSCSLISMTFFAQAVLLERDITYQQFAQLRTGTGSLVDFCLAMLGQLHQAQQKALAALRAYPAS